MRAAGALLAGERKGERRKAGGRQEEERRAVVGTLQGEAVRTRGCMSVADTSRTDRGPGSRQDSGSIVITIADTQQLNVLILT